MDSHSASQASISQNGKKPKPRRSFNPMEELALLNALKDIVSAGWKCDNGFRNGYLGQLEKALEIQFPGTDLKGDPHINSKIQVWKKNYATLCTMLSKSGFGWNSTTNTLDVRDDQVWDDYVKFDSKVKSWRYKSWPYFKDWEMLFGKDRATGETAETWQNVVEEEPYIPVPPEHDTPVAEETYAEQGETESVNVGPKSGETTSSTRKCKRKRGGEAQQPNANMVSIMNTFFAETNSQIGALVAKVGTERDAKGQRQNLFTELADMPLSNEDKIMVSKKICANVNDVDIFYGLDDENCRTMVRMVLDGTYHK